MDAQPPFKPTSALRLASARGFDPLCAAPGQKPVASWVPFDQRHAACGRLQAGSHGARHDQRPKLARGRSPRLLAITGGDAYVSADRHGLPEPSGGELARQVAAPLDTQSQHIAGLTRQPLPRALDASNKREGSVQ